MAKRDETSVPQLAEYISELASELAQMAKAANWTPLAYHLEMATLEAERLSQDDQDLETSCVRGASVSH